MSTADPRTTRAEAYSGAGWAVKGRELAALRHGKCLGYSGSTGDLTGAVQSYRPQAL